MSGPESKAVFLSYASQDAEAARRICDALRAAGVEVWFDQSELRGGDAWDAKIRKQIKECALFVPVISASTQARREGYFRREWKQAAERTRDMADGTPFFLPVVIDSTRDAEALVPEEFRAVQWTKSPGGETSAAFCERVNALLAGSDGRDVSPKRPSSAAQLKPGRLDQTSSPPNRSAMVAVAVGIAALAAVLIWQPWKHSASPNPKPQTITSAAIKLAADKSIAVLPFTNLNDDRESGFFADGVQEDILTNLALVRELRVVSRTSMGQYRETKKSMREIGGELGVTYVLEGSVRKFAGQVNVSAKLIRAATDQPVWAKSYQRELKEVFALQSTLATEIAGALQAVVSPEEQKLIARRPTENALAYELYLKARRIRDAATNIRSGVLQQISFLDSAVALDPGFALAWADLSWCHGWMYSFRGNDRTAARLEQTQRALDHALRLAPDAPEVRLNVAYFHIFMGEFSKAIAECEKLLAANPNHIAARFALGTVHRSAGRQKEAREQFLIVAEQDPGNGDYAGRAALALYFDRRYEEAARLYRRVAQLNPDDVWARRDVARMEFHRDGSTREMDEFFATLPEAELNSPRGARARMHWALVRGKVEEALRFDRASPRRQEETDLGEASLQDTADAIAVAAALAATGNRERAAERVQRARQSLLDELAQSPRSVRVLSNLALIAALLGEADDARSYLRRMQAVSDAGSAKPVVAFVLAWTGDKDAALAEYARLLPDRGPGSSLLARSVHEMRHDLLFHPLHGDPRFEALLNDPKNNAPLF